MFARLSAFVIWSLVAATAVFWALRFMAHPRQAPAYAVAVGKATPIRGDLSRLFGAAPVIAALQEAAPESSSRFKLVGVMAPRAGKAEGSVGYGLALIAVDGKPAKAFPVGARLDADLILQSVSLRTASIGPARGAPSVLLELPALPAAATGVLPPPGSTAPPGAAAVVQALRPQPVASPGQPVPAPAAPAAIPQPPGMLPPHTQQQVPPVAPAMQPAANPGLPSPDNFRSQ